MSAQEHVNRSLYPPSDHLVEIPFSQLHLFISAVVNLKVQFAQMMPPKEWAGCRKAIAVLDVASAPISILMERELLKLAEKEHGLVREYDLRKDGE